MYGDLTRAENEMVLSDRPFSVKASLEEMTKIMKDTDVNLTGMVALVQGGPDKEGEPLKEPGCLEDQVGLLLVLAERIMSKANRVRERLFG